MRLIVWLCLILSLPLSAAEVLVNQSVPLQALTQAQLRSIFTMRQTQWPDGSPIQVFVLPDSSAVHQRFSREQLHLFPYQLNTIWDRLIFSGTGARPVVVENESIMLQQLSSTAGSIGYVERITDNPSVKELRIDY